MLLVLQIAAGIALVYAVAIVADYVMTEQRRQQRRRYFNGRDLQ